MGQEKTGKDGLNWPDPYEEGLESGNRRKSVPWLAVVTVCVILAAALAVGIIAACLQLAPGSPDGEDGIIAGDCWYPTLIRQQ